jgi:hypothetical protein
LQDKHWLDEHWQQKHLQPKQRLAALGLLVERAFPIGASRAAAAVVNINEGAGESLRLQPGLQLRRRGVNSAGKGAEAASQRAENLLRPG